VVQTVHCPVKWHTLTFPDFTTNDQRSPKPFELIPVESDAEGLLQAPVFRPKPNSMAKLQCRRSAWLQDEQGY